MEFNWVEIVGACTGVAYLLLEVKQNMWLWPVGLLNAIFYAVIFYIGGLYAIMSLQLYYVVMMIYGWWNWRKGTTDNSESIAVTRVEGKTWIYLFLSSVVLWVLIYFGLDYLTDSEVPLWDGLTTALSIVGTWMLAKKYIEQWFVWIFVNLFSVWLYDSQGLHITAVLYAFYAIMAVVGYFQWRKDLCQE